MSGETIGGEATTGTVRVAGHQGDEIPAYLAHPPGPGPFAGVVVIHHMPGYDEATKEIARTFAANGYTAIMPNLHWRDAPGASPDDAPAARAAGGVPDERLVGDVDGAARHLRSLDSANGKVGVIGYCSGGRQAFLAACRLPLPHLPGRRPGLLRRRPAELPARGGSGRLAADLGLVRPLPGRLVRGSPMCTYHTERVEVAGSGKGPDGWFALRLACVYFDHPQHTPAAHTSTSTSSTPARDRRPGSPSS